MSATTSRLASFLANMSAQRSFSTSARVYPSYLPYVAASRRVGSKVVAPAAGVAAVTAGSLYVHDKVTQKRAEWTEASARAQREALEAQARFERLQDAYGGRTNLDELQAAIKAYSEPSK